MYILKFIFILLEVLVLFNLLIFVHELGHFLAARWRGLKIQRFAIWFGKPLWKTEINGVEYVLGCIPFGGYVSLPQMAPMDVIEGKSDTPQENLPPVSALDKSIVAFAGPLFSFALAVVFAAVVWGVKKPVSEAEKTTVIGYVFTNSPAERAGLRVGDEIVEVDDKPVNKFEGMGNSVKWRIVRSERLTIPIKIKRDGQIKEVAATPIREKTKPWQRRGLRQIMISPAYTPIVSKVLSNSPAARAGLQTGDEILEVNGIKLYHPAGLEDYAEKHGSETLALKGLRNNQPLMAALKPEIPANATNEPPQTGIVWVGGGKMELVRPGVVEQIRGSIDAMVSTFGALFSRKSDIKAQHLSGAVNIMNIYYRLFASEQGWRLALWFTVIINVNLALLNLLPIPVLDGGHITLAIIEGIRRKPVSSRVLNMLQTGCAVLLIGYILYITFYDVQDLPWKRAKEKAPQELKFAPKDNPPPVPQRP